MSINPGYFFPSTAIATYGEETALDHGRVPCAPCVLPSASSACDVVQGVPGAIPRAALHTAGRAVLIAAGIAIAGERDWTRLAKSSIGAALAIEVFTLSWAWSKREVPSVPPVVVPSQQGTP